MARTRDLEIWHIPKRQNVHQIIGAVEILAKEDFNGKSWITMRQENFNTQLGREGLTDSGRPLSPSARRTLEALLKYLGFIYIDKTTTPPTINVTNAGFELIKKHGSVLSKRKNLIEVHRNKEEIFESPLVEHQMAKLQITNPVISDDCINILLFPFRVTLRLLLELDFLTKEELGYIVFSMKKEDEFRLIVEKIRTFRNLPKVRKDAEIEAFKDTEIGNLTLVQAPTATYYMGLCLGTGLCERESDKLMIREDSGTSVRDILKKFEGIKPFDFRDNLKLWIDYFGSIERLQPPLLVSVKLKRFAHTFIKILDSNRREVDSGLISEDKTSVLAPLFKEEAYKFEFYSFTNAQKIYEETITINQDDLTFDIPIENSKAITWDFESIVSKILELISSSDFDSEFKRHLEVVKKITGRDNYNVAQLRGGRLEYLFFRLLNALKDKGEIDDVIWNGRLDDFGLAYPALGGKEGFPDIYFFIDGRMYVLEVTTIRANAMQWSAEGASVHDHLRNQLAKVGGRYEVVGLFTAPSILDRVTNMFAHISSKENIVQIPVPIEEFLEIIRKGRKSLKDFCDNYLKNKNIM